MTFDRFESSGSQNCWFRVSHCFGDCQPQLTLMTSTVASSRANFTKKWPFWAFESFFSEFSSQGSKPGNNLEYAAMNASHQQQASKTKRVTTCGSPIDVRRVHSAVPAPPPVCGHRLLLLLLLSAYTNFWWCSSPRCL